MATRNASSLSVTGDSTEPQAGVLIVDDQPANLLALEAVLGDLGHPLALVRAGSGEEALRLLQDRDFAVVLLDVRMDGMDGFQTARQARTRERSKHTPIIFLTANDESQSFLEEAYSLGVVDYLVKPLVPAILRAKVAAFVDLFRRKEQAEREADQLRLLIQGTIDYAVFMLDPEGRVASWNAGAERIKGYAAGEIVGHHFSRFYPRDALDRGWPAEELRRAEAEGRFADEGWRVRKDGSTFWANVVITALRDGAGGLRGFSKVTRDLTERRRREEELRQLHRDLEKRVEDRTAALVASTEALRESEARKAAILATALDGILTIDHAGTLIEFNPAAEAMFGYRREEVLGREMAAFIIPPPLRDAHRRGMARYLATGDGPALGRRIELTALRADGTEFPVELAITPIPGGGHPVFTGFVRDITQRKASETALRESEGQFRTLADSIPQLAWTARPDGYIFWYNRRWYEYTGTKPDEMEGWGWQGVHDPAELPKVLERWKGSIATGEPFAMVFPIKGADGVFRPFLTRVVPVRGDDDRVLRWFGTNTDISEIKAMEERLREADRRKDQWVMMLAHELRNPLAPIRTAVQVIQQPDADRVTVEKAGGMVERQVNHLTRIVDDLLDVSRVQSGKMSLRTERLDLGRFVRTVLRDQRAAFERAGVAVEAHLPEVPVWVTGDPTRLTQVLDNLLQNAVKFTDRGGSVAVRVEADAGRCQAVLRVRDTGIGIEPDLLPQLFETFTQADRSLDRSKGGLGLGLSLVKGLAELHGGEARATSDGPARGSEFVVRLPLQPEPAAVTDVPAPLPRAPKRLRVLVVEDNRDAADSLKMMLEVFGYAVVVAYTGPSGVDAAKEWKPDVVVCDIGLPGLDGYGVARELRRIPATATARMIAVTGYGGEDDRRQSREAGFDAHLTKPADPTALQDLLAQTGPTL